MSRVDWTQEQWQKALGRLDAGKEPKYHSRKVEVDGETFDSKAEYRRWLELRALEQAGEISGLIRQERYTLLDAFTDNTGKRQRAITYRPDFTYTDTRTGQLVVEDVKGFTVRDFPLREKMFRARYPDIMLVVLKR